MALCYVRSRTNLPKSGFWIVVSKTLWILDRYISALPCHWTILPPYNCTSTDPLLFNATTAPQLRTYFSPRNEPRQVTIGDMGDHSCWVPGMGRRHLEVLRPWLLSTTSFCPLHLRWRKSSSHLLFNHQPTFPASWYYVIKWQKLLDFLQHNTETWRLIYKMSYSLISITRTSGDAGMLR